MPHRLDQYSSGTDLQTRDRLPARETFESFTITLWFYMKFTCYMLKMDSESFTWISYNFILTSPLYSLHALEIDAL